MECNQKVLDNCYIYSSTAVGMRCKDGVVFAVEKLVQSKLYEPGANKRYFTIDRHVGMVGVVNHCSSEVSLVSDCNRLWQD